MARTRHLHWVGLAAVAVLVTACGGGAPPAPTVKVDRGPVSTSVSASGTLVSINEQNLGFADRGQIAEIMVKVGDKVTKGQPLARLDDAALSQALASAKAKLDQQNAALGKITGSYTVEGAQAALDAANAVLHATESNVNAVNAANADATRRAKVQLDFDREVLRTTPCDPPSTTSPAAKPKPAQSDNSDGNTSSRNSGGLIGNSSMGQPATTEVRPVAFSTPLTGDDDDDGFQTCAGKQAAQRQVIASETAYNAAKHTEDTAATQGRISIANAQAQVVTAENTLESAGRDNSADAKVQEAVRRDAQIAVDGAQRDLANATLKAPADGTVSSINGLVGEFIQGSTGGTPQAPGVAARVPNATGGTTGTTGTTGGTAAGAFITLTNIDSFQLVVPFEESDAAQVAANQQVEVSIDALDGLTKPGTVVSVAPTSDTISGVVSYYATIVLNETDPRLKDGQTAQADVITKTVPNALRVPSNAIRKEATGTVVSIPGPNGQPVPQPVTTGLQGDQFTEITSGLQDGQDVVLPQANVAATGGTSENRGGGRGGG
ncbi:biotin/lipoyl-binding protein [Pseudonocardia sp. CA-107938]|uniref:biotin/lipoyl-binding protein n=1 Tax=Pseudonocardia sp. CA-107938 TaxID=3240021 RepID=UPI003D8BCEA0